MKIVLETGRLLLREFTLDDVEDLVRLDSDPEVIRMTSPDRPPPGAEALREKLRTWHFPYYLKHPGCGFWPAEEKPDRGFIGWFHLKRSPELPQELELGYRFLPRARNRGLATEGSLALIRKGFETLGAHRITAHALVENAPSIRVMEKAGLRFDSRFVHPTVKRDCVQYAITRSDWRGRPA